MGGRFNGVCVNTRPGESQDSMVDQSSVMYVRASTTERPTDSPSTMRAESPVVPPYEPPRLHVRGTRPIRLMSPALSSPTSPRVSVSACHGHQRTQFAAAQDELTRGGRHSILPRAER